MIFGTGVDIVEIARIKNSLEKYSGRFEEKIFTAKEIDYCRRQPAPERHFAARFAVKEAVLKCLGTGMSRDINWKNIEVINQDNGKPIVLLNGKGKALFEKLKLKAIHISISHDRIYAIAQAIAER